MTDVALHVLSAGAAKAVVTTLAVPFRNGRDVAVAATFDAAGAIRARLVAGDPCDVVILPATMLQALADEEIVQRASLASLGCVPTSRLLPTALTGHAVVEFDGTEGRVAWQSVQFALEHAVVGDVEGSVSADASEIAPTGELTIGPETMSLDLQARIDENAREVSRGMVGTRQHVLVEGAARKDAAELSGRTANNRVVNFAGPRALVGRFADVIITAALPHSLRGELAASPH